MENLLFIGLGRIGLPQSLVFAKKGFRVTAYDLDDQVISQIKNKQTPFYEPSMDEYLHSTLNNTFFPTHEWEKVIDSLAQIDAIFFTLGTSAPNSQSCLQEKQLDLSSIEKTLDKILINKQKLKPEVKFIFRTTLPLGSIERLRLYIEKNHALIESKDFHLAFVPERLMEGNAIREEETLPKIIGCHSEKAYVQIKSIFEKIGGDIIHVTNPITAEFCKLTDNSFRNTLFSFSNEIAMHASQLGVDAVEVIKAINHGYKRNHVPYPGFVSGYCLGKDPYIFEYGFLNNKKNRDFHSLWYYGRQTNDYLVDFVVDKLLNHLQGINNPSIALLGLSFKEDIDDFRMSHSLNILEKLIAAGIKRFRLFDTHLDKNKYTILPESLNQFVEFRTNYLNAELFSNCNALLICHRHQEIIDTNKRQIISELLSNNTDDLYIFDSWNVWREAEGLPKVIYESLGYNPL